MLSALDFQRAKSPLLAGVAMITIAEVRRAEPMRRWEDLCNQARWRERSPMSDPTAKVTGATRKNALAAAARMFNTPAESNATAALGTKTTRNRSKSAFIVPFTTTLLVRLYACTTRSNTLSVHMIAVVTSGAPERCGNRVVHQVISPRHLDIVIRGLICTHFQGSRGRRRRDMSLMPTAMPSMAFATR